MNCYTLILKILIAIAAVVWYEKETEEKLHLEEKAAATVLHTMIGTANDQINPDRINASTFPSFSKPNYSTSLQLPYPYQYFGTRDHSTSVCDVIGPDLKEIKKTNFGGPRPKVKPVGDTHCNCSQLYILVHILCLSFFILNCFVIIIVARLHFRQEGETMAKEWRINEYIY